MYRLLLALLLLLPLPALGTVTDNTPELTHTASWKLWNLKMIRVCVGLTGGNADRLGRWLDGSKQCTGYMSTGKEDDPATTLVDESRISAVDLGICSQAEADAGDPWPTQTCIQSRADDGYCKQAHVGLVQIPKILSCRRFLNQKEKARLQRVALSGKAAIALQLLPAPDSADDGDVVDP